MSLRIGKEQALVIFQAHLWLFMREEKRIRSKLFDAAATKSDAKVVLTTRIADATSEQTRAHTELSSIERDEHAKRAELDAISHTILELQAAQGIVPVKRGGTLRGRTSLGGGGGAAAAPVRSGSSPGLSLPANATGRGSTAGAAISTTSTAAAGTATAAAPAAVHIDPKVAAAAAVRMATEIDNRNRLWDALAAVITARNACNDRLSLLERRLAVLTFYLNAANATTASPPRKSNSTATATATATSPTANGTGADSKSAPAGTATSTDPAAGDESCVDVATRAVFDRLRATRDDELALKKQLVFLLKSRDALSVQYTKLKADASAHANSYYAIDAKRTNRQVLQRMCEEIQSSGLVRDHKRTPAATTAAASGSTGTSGGGDVLTKSLAGGELLRWLIASDVFKTERDAVLFADLLLWTGLIDLLSPNAASPDATAIIPAAASNSSLRTQQVVASQLLVSIRAAEIEAITVNAFGTAKVQPEFYRFRCDPLLLKSVRKSGWLWKATRWSSYRRFFVCHALHRRLIYYKTNHDPKATPNRVFYLSRLAIIRVLDGPPGIDPPATVGSGAGATNVSSGSGASAASPGADSIPSAHKKYYFQISVPPFSAAATIGPTPTAVPIANTNSTAAAATTNGTAAAASTTASPAANANSSISSSGAGPAGSGVDDVEVVVLFTDTERERKDWLRVLWLSGCSFVPSVATTAKAVSGGGATAAIPIHSSSLTLPADDDASAALSASLQSIDGQSAMSALAASGEGKSSPASAPGSSPTAAAAFASSAVAMSGWDRLTRSQREARILNEFTVQRVKCRTQLKQSFTHFALADSEFLEILGIIDSIETQIKQEKKLQTEAAAAAAAITAAANAKAGISTPATGAAAATASGGGTGQVEVILQSREETRDERQKADAERKARKAARQQHSDRLSAQLRTLLERRTNPLGKVFATYMDLYTAMYCAVIQRLTDVDRTPAPAASASTNSIPINTKSAIGDAKTNSPAASTANATPATASATSGSAPPLVPLEPATLTPPTDSSADAVLKAAGEDLRWFHASMRVLVLSVLGSNLSKPLARACASTIEACMFEVVGGAGGTSAGTATATASAGGAIGALRRVYVRANRFRDTILDDRLSIFQGVTLKTLGLSKELYAKKEVPPPATTPAPAVAVAVDTASASGTAPQTPATPTAESAPSSTAPGGLSHSGSLESLASVASGGSASSASAAAVAPADASSTGTGSAASTPTNASASAHHRTRSRNVSVNLTDVSGVSGDGGGGDPDIGLFGERTNDRDSAASTHAVATPTAAGAAAAAAASGGGDEKDSSKSPAGRSIAAAGITSSPGGSRLNAISENEPVTPAAVASTAATAIVASTPTAASSVAAPADPLASDPYFTAIETFRSISNLRLPAAKLDAIVAVAHAICGCVDKLHGKSNFVIGADDLLILFAYIIVKARVPSLWAELQVMDDFISEKHRCMVTGYYLATTQAAVELVLTNDLRIPQTDHTQPQPPSQSQQK